MCCACGGGRRDYVFYMYDSYGHGWNSANYTFTHSDGTDEYTGTLGSGLSYGTVDVSLETGVYIL